MFWHSLGWRNISLLYWMDLKRCFSLHSKGTTESIVPFVLWVSMEDLLTALALLLSANWGPLMSLDPGYLHHLIPEIWRLSNDEKTAQFGFYCPVSVYIQPHLVTRSIDPDFTTSGLPNLVPSTFFRNNWACLPSWITHCSECNL